MGKMARAATEYCYRLRSVAVALGDVEAPSG